MIGCLFVMNIFMAIPVMSNDLQTQIHTLYPGDKVCVMEIKNGWLGTHWATARGHQHGGWVWSNVYKDNGPKEAAAPDED